MAKDQNLDALRQAAKTKLEAQKKAEQPGATEDIYAEIRDEVIEDTYPTIKMDNNENAQPGLEFKDDNDYDMENPVNSEDYEIYEDGPYMSQVELWKKQYGAGRVIHTQVIEKHFVFRTLNRFEYKQVIAMENVDALMREEIICSTCVLFPRNYNFKKMATSEGGYPSTLAQIIMENSGFTKEYGIEIL